MNYREKYEMWLQSPIIDEKTKEELLALAGNEKEIEDRFYKDLEFGTGGLRGVIGAGSNRINNYTVEKQPRVWPIIFAKPAGMQRRKAWQ